MRQARQTLHGPCLSHLAEVSKPVHGPACRVCCWAVAMLPAALRLLLGRSHAPGSTCDTYQSELLPAALYLLLGGPMLPPNKGWAVFLLWICAHAGGYIAARVNLPPLLGMLVAGIILQNIPQGEPCLQLFETFFKDLPSTPCSKASSSFLPLHASAMISVLPLCMSARLAWPHETAKSHTVFSSCLVTCWNQDHTC